MKSLARALRLSFLSVLLLAGLGCGDSKPGGPAPKPSGDPATDPGALKPVGTPKGKGNDPGALRPVGAPK